MRRAIFVTATGTEVGKTFVAAGLVKACRRAGRPVAALKPVISGFDEASPVESDTAILLEAMGQPVTDATLAAVSPWRFRAPLAPDMAAALAGRSLACEAITAFCREAIAESGPKLVIIEGVGGVMVPLGRRHTVLDVIAALPVRVLLVSPTGLGAISHLLTALEALKARGVRPAAIVLSETPGATVPLDLTLSTLADFWPAEDLFVLTRARAPQEAIFDAILARLGV